MVSVFFVRRREKAPDSEMRESDVRDLYDEE
jgi:hypothetical protein